jgi:D-3-phosphoglycerate dehydrogenase / 2-oxoglutarate reductase
MTGKPKPKVLVSDKLAQEGVDILLKKCDVTVKTGMPEDELIKMIPEFEALLVRAATKVNAKVIEAAKNMKIVGRAGVGVDNIDVPAATQAGILVVNSPEGNILSAAEHTLALMLALSRNVAQANSSMKEGKWDKNKFVGVQVGEKTLGIVGFGKIGKLVGERAVGLGMKVLVADPYTTEDAVARISGRLVDLDVVYSESDYITFHVPKSKETLHMCSVEEFKKMKKGVRVINVSRGGVVDEAALAEALKSGKVAGAALDVFEAEPLGESELRNFPNCIMTPHLGASTEEAQTNVAIDVAKQVLDYFDGIPPAAAVNMPGLKPEILKRHHPYFALATILGTLVEGLRGEQAIEAIEITYKGAIAGMQTNVITRYFLMGMLRPHFSESVNVVNAPILFKNRGVKITETSVGSADDVESEMLVTVSSSKETHSAWGMIVNGDVRITGIDGFGIDLVPQGHVIFINHTDQPGMIGKVGALLGNNNINIAGMQVGREKARGNAVMALTVDEEVPENLQQELKRISGIRNVKLIAF